MLQNRFGQNDSSQAQLALVLGANGGFGSEVARALLKHGWRVRCFARTINDNALPHARLEWWKGDALDRSAVIEASAGASIIVHAVNPANYHNWRGLALPMLENTIAAANLTRARVVFPGCLYNYGHDAFPCVAEDSPQNPVSAKGEIRVAMEERLRDACWEGRMKTVIMRTGDSFGPQGHGSWLTNGMVTRLGPAQVIFNPGHPSVFHSWAYLPDVAETVARLLKHETSLAKFDAFHFRGHVLRNTHMAQVVCDVAGLSRRRIRQFPWWAIRASAPLVELSREMSEMRYLWNESLTLDNTKLRSLIGAEPHTPLEEAVRATLVGAGYLQPTSRFTRAGELTRS